MSSLANYEDTESVKEDVDTLDAVLFKDLLQLEKVSATQSSLCRKQYRRRFRKIAGLFVEDVDGLTNVMDLTDSYISGSLTMLFLDPDFFDGEIVTETHDMDIYTTPMGVEALVKFFSDIEHYKLDWNEQVQGEGRPYELGSQSGINKVLSFKKGTLNIDIIESAGNHAFIPILHFHFTVPMNALGPFSFTSFYAHYTLDGKGLFSDTAFESDAKIVDYGHRKIKERARKAAVKYERKGFTIKELPDFLGDDHSRMCLTRACRQIRYSDDVESLRVYFDGAKKRNETTMFSSVVRWSIGGYMCGAIGADDFYCPFFVNPNV